MGKCGGDEDDLGGGRKVTIHVVDLLLEPFVQHLVSLVQYLTRERENLK